MPRLSQAASFDRTISQLLAKRREYTEGLAQIEGIFAKYNIQVANGSSQTAPQARRVATAMRASKSRKRGIFSQTADELILSMLKGKPMVTREVTAAWKRAGRGGKPDNTLGKLVKEKRIKRTPVKDGRGSSYTLA